LDGCFEAQLDATQSVACFLVLELHLSTYFLVRLGAILL